MRKLLLSAFVLALCANTAKAIETDASGVYQIATAQDLVDFAAIVNGRHSSITQNASASAVVTANIDMSGTSYTPIGISDSNPYVGTFDGGNHTITLSSSKVSSGNNNGTGLFGQAGTCRIQNITVAGTVGVTGTTQDVGGIVGRVPTGTATITNCHNKANIGAHYKAGGIVGIVENGGTAIITNCTNSGSIKSSAAWCASGGIVGWVLGTGSVTLENCINTGSVSDPQNAGGLVGKAEAVITVKNCANIGTVSGNGTVGTLVGYFKSTTTIENCYNACTDTSHKFFGSIGSSASPPITNCYDINGTCADNGVTAFTSAELTSGALCYNLNGGSTDNTVVWRQTVGEGYPTFSGSIVYAYYENCTTTERTYTNTASTDTPHLTIGHRFGSDNKCEFCGTSAAEAEYFLTGAEVDNATVVVTVTRNDVTTTLTNGSSTAKAGETLSLTVTPANGYYFSNATNAAKTLTVKITSAMVSDGKIDISSALKYYAVHQHEYDTYGKCTTCQALKTYTLAAPPTSTYVVLTVVKKGDTELAAGATLTYGDVLTVTVKRANYAVWSDKTTNTDIARTFTITVGLTDPNKEIAAKVALAVCNHAPQTSGVCDRCGHYDALTDNDKVDGYYQIATAGDLMAFADIVNGTNGASKNVNACATVTADIDFTNITSVSYTPIGKQSDNRYGGTFDGGEKTITLKINSNEDYQGLFGDLATCTIKNVIVAGTISTFKSYVGGIAGRNYNDATITNCVNKATVSGAACVGGIVGWGDDDLILSKCTNTGSISGNSNVGGIVGYHSWSSLSASECVNSGSVTAIGAYCGGIVGQVSTSGNIKLEKCVNDGTIKSSSTNVGGICGYCEVANSSSSSITLKNLANRGSVTSTSNSNSYTGSIIGHLYGKVTLTGCYNSVSNSYSAIGYNGATSATITRCYDINSTAGNTVLPCTADEIKSGALCYNLNGGVEDLAWYQKLTGGDDADAYPVLTATEDEGNVVNYIKKDGTAAYFNTGSEASVANTDATKFCVVDELDATEKAQSNLNAVEDNVNMLFKSSSDDTYTCANAVLVDGTAYRVDKAYTATKFTYERTLATGNKGISTFMLPIAVSVSEVNGKVYKLSSLEDNTLNFEEVTGMLEANTPYIVENTTTSGDQKLFTTSLSNVSVSAMAAGTVSVSSGAAIHYGAYTTKTSEANGSDTDISGNDIYGYADGKFIKATGTWTLPAFHTMILVPTTSGALGAPALSIDLGDGGTSGISSTAADGAETVDVYSVSGVRLRTGVSGAKALNGLPAGIYVVNGKKLVKK